MVQRLVGSALGSEDERTGRSVAGRASEERRHMSLSKALRVASLAALAACSAACPRTCRDASSTPNVEISTKPTLKRPSSPEGDAAQLSKTAAATGGKNARSALGYNMDFPGDWSLVTPFIDLMHDARVWE